LATAHPKTKLLLLVDELNALPTQYQWIFADSALLQAVSQNKPVERGTRGRLLFHMISVSRRLGVAWVLVALVSIIEFIRMWSQQRAAKNAVSGEIYEYPARFFVGFGAGAEEPLFLKYCVNGVIQTARLDQINIASFAVWHQVGFFSGLHRLMNALFVASKALDAISSHYSYWRVDFLTCIAMKAGYSAYMRAWFESLKVKTGASLEEVAFLSPDTAAFAAVDAGLPVCFLQHGMIRHSLILPALCRAEALTVDEARHMKCRLPLAQVTTHSQWRRKLDPSLMTKAILIASIYGSTEYMSLIAPFVFWANAKKVPLHVRPHPRENSTYWQSYALAGQVIIAKDDADIYQAIDRLRPRLMVSWFSTAVLNALECGIIPITVCTDDDSYVIDMVYPLFKRCLRWPQDMKTIERLLYDDEYYVSVLSRLTEESREVAA
jgi:hypothetical protein